MAVSQFLLHIDTSLKTQNVLGEKSFNPLRISNLSAFRFLLNKMKKLNTDFWIC